MLPPSLGPGTFGQLPGTMTQPVSHGRQGQRDLTSATLTSATLTSATLIHAARGGPSLAAGRWSPTRA
jgi:hypothetical protein